MLTVSAFLKSDAFERVSLDFCEHEHFDSNGDGRVGVKFDGSYTVEEVAAALTDLRRVQRAYETACANADDARFEEYQSFDGSTARPGAGIYE